MCGIVGYVGRRSAAPILLEGLKKLEYRGYDSAGVAVLDKKNLHVMKRVGSVEKLGQALSFEGRIGIGHTRWATHGAPTEANAHPHVYGRIAIVHNGIIENMKELKEECLARGEKFASETDTELVAHLMERYFEGDILLALRRAAARLTGSFAIAALCAEGPEKIALARRSSPLVVGRGEDGMYLASDIPAIAAKGMEVFALGDGEFALLEEKEIRFFAEDGREIHKEHIDYDCEEDVPEKKGYRHFMRKEMAEIPSAIANTQQITKTYPRISELREVLCHAEYIHIVACGTAYHSGLCAKVAFEARARVPAEVTVASEYRYRDPIIPKGALVVAVSQSGETADTLAAAHLAKERGAVVVAVTNVRYSSLARLADFVLFTAAGREIGVAATKSFNAQLALLYALAEELAKAKGRGGCGAELSELSALAEDAVKAADGVRGWTPHFLGAKSVFFLGRGADYCAALEGSLKLKEITYVPSEGYPAGELKHGTLALIEEGTPVVAVLTSRRLAEKTMNAVHETYARGAKVFLITSLPEYCTREEILSSVTVPDIGEIYSPALSVIPLQALAYYVSVARGNDPDKPRNLAKSVTVE